MTTYAWSEGSRHTFVDPNEVGKELSRLRKSYGGALTAEMVVEVARKKSSPLHELFEWNDKEAAHQHRLEQARNIIRHIVVISNGDTTPRRAFVHVQAEEGSFYADTVEALASPDLRAQVLARAKAEMDSFVRRYEELEELSAVINAAKKTSRLLASSK